MGGLFVCIVILKCTYRVVQSEAKTTQKASVATTVILEAKRRGSIQFEPRLKRSFYIPVYCLPSTVYCGFAAKTENKGTGCSSG